MSGLVLFMFAGRRANMEIQWPYLTDILSRFPNSELHIWDLARTPEDREYLWDLNGAETGRVQVLGRLVKAAPRCLYPKGLVNDRLPRGWRRCTCLVHKPPYEKPYIVYAHNSAYRDSVFVKIDDDVLFLETARFADLIAPLADHPNRVISANVVNNAVCAKYETRGAFIEDGVEPEPDPTDPANDYYWWAKHVDPEFARSQHETFLLWYNHVLGVLGYGYGSEPQYVRTRPGEALSINCIAFTHVTMKRLATWFKTDPRLGDEGAVDKRLPWICRSFHAAHLAFGPQEKAMTTEELDGLRERYLDLRKAYLGE